MIFYTRNPMELVHYETIVSLYNDDGSVINVINDLLWSRIYSTENKSCNIYHDYGIKLTLYNAQKIDMLQNCERTFIITNKKLKQFIGKKNAPILANIINGEYLINTIKYDDFLTVVHKYNNGQIGQELYSQISKDYRDATDTHTTAIDRYINLEKLSIRNKYHVCYIKIRNLDFDEF